MGFKTTIVISNDRLYDIRRDAEAFVEEITRMAGGCLTTKRALELKQYPHFYGLCDVVDVSHADTATLVMVSDYSGEILAHWNARKRDDAGKLAILKEAADKLGYRLSKKPKKKES